MLTMAHMGGMEEMNVFYEDCLEELYPPGVCGTFCNEHTCGLPARTAFAYMSASARF